MLRTQLTTGAVVATMIATPFASLAAPHPAVPALDVHTETISDSSHEAQMQVGWRFWRDRDNNPPGRLGGPGTNWENPPGPRGGEGVSPDRPWVNRIDPDNNPPGKLGGEGTNWENPPGPAGGIGASPDRWRWRGLF